MNWLGSRAALCTSTAVALALWTAGAAIAQNPPAAIDPVTTPAVAAAKTAATPPVDAPSTTPPQTTTPDAASSGATPGSVQRSVQGSAPASSPASVQGSAQGASQAPALPQDAAQAAEPAPIKTVAQKYDVAIGPQKPAENLAIREALARELTSLTLSAQRRALLRAVDQFYAERGDAPLWRDGDHWSAAGASVFDQIQQAGDDALDLSAYRVFALGAGSAKGVAAADVALSAAAAAYAQQASGGRVDTQKISRLIGVQPPVVGAGQALTESSASADAGATLEAYNPAFPGYKALKQRLTALRETEAQKRGAPDVTSSIAPRPSSALERELIVNMEFWRWLPRQLGPDRVVVNIPEFTGRLYRNDVETLDFRVITGKPDKATPLFSNKMAYIVVNPSWNVPQSIIRNEFLPKLAALRAQGYEIFTANGQLHVRQPPGERNALGQVKFVFPNDYAVYMHDTPTRKLFNEDRRAFSHGCVRVDQPFRLAEAILGPDRYSQERLRKMVGSTERRINLSESLPVHFVYFTVTDDGQLHRFDDIYGYERKTAEALGLAAAEPSPGLNARLNAPPRHRAGAGLGARLTTDPPGDDATGVGFGDMDQN